MTNGRIDKLVVKLNNRKSGEMNRSKHPGLAAKYPDCVIIERVSNQYTLRKRSGDVSTTATVIQFPIKVAFAITSHKIQGQTIPWPIKVVLHLDSIFEDAQAHVMLSRAQQISQIYILNRLDEKKIRTSRIGLAETKRLEAISLNANPSPWCKENSNCLKVVSLNCAGLQAHFRDIQVDNMLVKGDIIHLIETSLEESDPSPLKLDKYDVHMTSVGRGKGISTYYRPAIFKHEKDLKSPNIQITKYTSEYLDVINVYRSNNGNTLELLSQLTQILTPGIPVLITGDFNICFMANSKNRVSKGLMEKEGFQQLVREPTQIMGGHIDHVYWRDRSDQWNQPILERYTPYYSDHDASCITLIKEVGYLY